MNLFKGMFDHSRRHHGTRQMPPWIRKPMYRQLLSLMDEEQNAKELLNLPIEPRLSVVDEERVAVLRPSDGQSLGLDEELQHTRDQLADERRTEPSNG